MLGLKAMFLQIDLSFAIRPLPLRVFLFLELKDFGEGRLLDIRGGIIFSIEVLVSQPSPVDSISLARVKSSRGQGRGGVQSLLEARRSLHGRERYPAGYQRIKNRRRVFRPYLVARGLLPSR